jgi:hypothetical protein
MRVFLREAPATRAIVTTLPHGALGGGADILVYARNNQFRHIFSRQKCLPHPLGAALRKSFWTDRNACPAFNHSQINCGLLTCAA